MRHAGSSYMGDGAPRQKRKRIARLRDASAKKQGNRCFWCKRSVWPDKITAEHIVPESKGGRDHPRNIVMACDECNNARGAMDAVEFAESQLLLMRDESRREARRKEMFAVLADAMKYLRNIPEHRKQCGVTKP